MIRKLCLMNDYCTPGLSWDDAMSILDSNGCIVTVTHSYEYRIAFKYSGEYLIKYIGAGKGEYVVVNRAIRGIQHIALGASNLRKQGSSLDLGTYFTVGGSYSKINVHPNAFGEGCVRESVELPKVSQAGLQGKSHLKNFKDTKEALND